MIQFGDKWLLDLMARAAAAEAAGHLVEGPVPHIRRYIGPDASACGVCGRPGCVDGNRMFVECEVAPDTDGPPTRTCLACGEPFADLDEHHRTSDCPPF